MKKYWMDKDGKMKEVKNHIPYAETILGVSEKTVGTKKVYDEMFRLGYLQLVEYGDATYVAFFKNKDVRTLLNDKQKKTLYNLAEHFVIRDALTGKQIEYTDLNLYENKKKVKTNDNLSERVSELYSYMAKRLEIKSPPKVYFVNSVSNCKKPFGLTGVYNNKDRSIKVYITNRHPIDIMRSIAHELIHHWQNENGKFKETDKQRAEELREPHYAQKDPHLRQMEKQAYLLGNIL